MRITCPHCHGSCVEKTDRRIEDTQHQHTDATVPCTRCNGRGWIDDGVTTVLPPPPPDEQMHDGGTKKPRQAEGWLLGVGALILLGLLGHVLNQQRLSKQTPDTDEVERSQPESAPVPEAPPSDATRRTDADDLKPAAPMPAVYMVTHKHRLRDCHGRLTFTRKGLRYDSDEPGDSFDVTLDDVTIDGDVVSIRNKPWRFEFDGGVGAERIFQDWKAGVLRSVFAP